MTIIDILATRERRAETTHNLGERKIIQYLCKSSFLPPHMGVEKFWNKMISKKRGATIVNMCFNSILFGCVWMVNYFK